MQNQLQKPDDNNLTQKSQNMKASDSKQVINQSIIKSKQAQPTAKSLQCSQNKQQNCQQNSKNGQQQPTKQIAQQVNSSILKQKQWQEIQQIKSRKKRLQFCDGSIVFLVDPQYEIKKLIGSGIYGIVAAGTNLITKQQVAIKKISRLFNNFGDTKRVLREIKVLEFLNHKNIISLKDIMSIDDPQTFNQIYLIMEFMEFDLRRLIQSQTKITQQMIKYIMYQLLAAINFMHSADILHRDLKPQNILMNKKCELKVADMNLARKQTPGIITDYVASRPYRAPEILIGSTVYTKSVDIWSIGCIFAQLLGKTIIFQGKDFIDQLKRFVAILGKPKVEYFPHIDKTSMQSLAKLIAQIPDKEKVQWKYLMPNINQKAADLLDHMLSYDASARYTAEECLNHPYLEQYRKAPKIKCKETFDFSFDKIELKQNILRKAIYEAIQQFQQQKKNQLENYKNSILQDKLRKKIKPNEN